MRVTNEIAYDVLKKMIKERALSEKAARFLGCGVDGRISFGQLKMIGEVGGCWIMLLTVKITTIL